MISNKLSAETVLGRIAGLRVCIITIWLHLQHAETPQLYKCNHSSWSNPRAIGNSRKAGWMEEGVKDMEFSEVLKKDNVKNPGVK